MYSKHHAVLSFLVGLTVISLLEPVTAFGTEVPAGVLLAYATAVGVLIDLDHFVIARIRTGGWDAVRFCLQNPSAAVADQRRIFAVGDVGTLTRLLSHLVVLGTLVSGLAFVDSTLAVVTAAVLYVHLVSDVAWDIRRYRRAGIPVENLVAQSNSEPRQR